MHVFLSYSSEDRESANQLREALNRQGYTVWQDQTNLPGGSEWIREIERGINDSFALVALVSCASNQSHWVAEEVAFAKARSIRVIPVQIEDCELVLGYATLSVLRVQDHIEDVVPKLTEALSAVLRARELDSDDEATAPSMARRSFEQAYADGVVLRYSVYQTLYTPLAGAAEVLEEPQAPDVSMRVTPAAIDAEFQLFLEERVEKPSRPAKVRKEDLREDILRAVREVGQFVLLGEPGAGKSTTLWRIALDQAKALKHDVYAPVPVIVRLGEIETGETLRSRLLHELGRLAPYIDTLEQTGRVTYLLDGLNELQADVRSGVVAEIQDILAGSIERGNVCIVACRELDFDPAVFGDWTVSRVVIAPLDAVRIHRFLDAYLAKPEGIGSRLFWQLAGADAKAHWDRFAAAVGDDSAVFWRSDHLPPNATWGWDQPGYEDFYWKKWLVERSAHRQMLDLVSNPFMLFMVAQVFRQYGGERLPTNQAHLFNTFVDFLLLRREGATPVEAEAIKEGLGQLAHAMQKQGLGTSVPRANVDPFLPERLLHTARSANILEGRNLVRFSHQLLQEFFAAHRLYAEILDGVPAATYWPADAWWVPNGWEVTTRLMAGLPDADLSTIVAWLADAHPELAAECIAEHPTGLSPDARTGLRQRWMPRLTDPAREPTLAGRAAVGRALGRLELDDRPGVGLRPDGLPDIAWCDIEGGTYTIGDDAQAFEPLPPTRFELAQGFRMAKYPLTNAQFQAFVEAEDGPSVDEWWQGLALPQQDIRPARWPFSNHPVDSVSWYQSVAYTRWLTSRLRKAGLLGADREIRLPTEQEWEVAASFGHDGPFPWGDTYEIGITNVDETRDFATHGNVLNQTSAVGAAPGSDNPVTGMADLAGNVWEWCVTDHSNPNESIGQATPIRSVRRGNIRRTLRGASWGSNVQYARIGTRGAIQAFSRLDFVGMRLVEAAVGSVPDSIYDEQPRSRREPGPRTGRVGPLDRDDVYRRVRHFVLEQLIHDPNYPLGDEDDFVAAGLIDPVSLVVLGGFIEDEFDVYIPDAELNAERMNILEQIVARIMKGAREG